MNQKQKELRIKRVEKFGDAVSGSLAASALAALLKDGHVVIENLTPCCAAIVWAAVLYWIFSWLLNEMAKDTDNPVSANEEGD